MRGRAALMVSVLAVAALAASCSSSSSGNKGTKPEDISANWDAKGTTEVQQAARKIAARLPGQCADLKMSDRVTYVGSSEKIGTPIPLAVGSCPVLEEDVEISAFANAHDRDVFVKARADVLCQRSAAQQVALPGLRWAVGSNISMQPDSEGIARRVATAVGYRYRLTACPDQTADWAARDTAHVMALAASLKKAGIGCGDVQLQDRDLLSHNEHYLKTGLPGSYARCTVGDDPNVGITSFDDTKTPFSSFLVSEQQFLCGSSRDTKVVIGTDWAVFLPKGANAGPIGKALHGKSFGGACPSA